MKRPFLSLLISCLATLCAQAQLHCTFTHYSLENGLSENTVMDMVQDHDGLVWIATWHGINCFDGYNFRVFTARQSHTAEWTSNRIDHLSVDAKGDVWCISYDSHAFRLDRHLETFQEVPVQTDGQHKPIIALRPLDNGTMWLLTDHDGGYRMTDGEAVVIGEGTRIHQVFLDSQGTEWVLTDNGLLRIDPKEGKVVSYFTQQGTGTTGGQPFFSVEETDGTLLFGSANGRVWMYSMSQDLFDLRELPLKDDVIAIQETGDGQQVAVTATQGIVTGSIANGRLNVVPTGPVFDFGKYPVQSVYTDREGELWLNVDREGTVCHFNPRTQVLKVERMAVEIEPADRSNPNFAICEDIAGHLWVHPMGGGLSWFDRAANRLIPFYDEIGSSQWRFSNKLHAMMTDRQGNLWLGTHSKGLEKVTFFKDQFRLWQPLACNYDTYVNQVRSLCEDRLHRLWIGTRDGRINVYGADRQHLGYLTTDGRIARQGTPFIGVAYKIIEDSHGDLWIATKGQGVLHLQGKGPAFRMEHFTHNPDDLYSLSGNSVYDVAEDGQGRLWVITFYDGINYLERRPDGSARFVNSRNHLKSYPMERCSKARRMVRDTQGRLWVATANGLLSFDERFQQAEDIRFELYAHEQDPQDGLGENNVYDMLLTRQGELFLATFGGGLMRLKGTDDNGRAQFESFTQREGLPTDVLYSLAEDGHGNLWIGSENGLSCMNMQTRHFDNYLRQELGEDLVFEESTSLSLSDGRLAFGSNRGVLTFRPEQIHKNCYVPEIVFSGLKIAGQLVRPGEDSPLQESLNTLSRLKLSHRQNTLSLHFAALDFTYPENVRYAYRLKGFDRDWNYIDRQRTATYTNLPHGDYTLQVRSTNGNGVWVDNQRDLHLHISPAFHETPMAYVLYVLGFLIVLAGGAYILFTIFRLKHEVSVEQQLTNLKLRFFTNISHELRTPLTLIAGPLEHILKHSELTDEVRGQLQVVERNTDRMLRMVNQILDFRKIQNNKMKLMVEQVDIVPFVRKVMDNFETLATEHKMDFLFESECASLKLWIDPDKVEKMVFNLLSNAFKYTSDGKTITVFIHENEQTVAIGVQDQGIGIAKNRQSSLFVRFENLVDKHLFTANSTGIGLSLVKELADMHGARIQVDSEEGKGSRFTLVFQKGKAHYAEDTEFIVNDGVELAAATPAKAAETTETAETAAPETGVPASEQQTLLLVEDNIELRGFLRTIFAERFHVVEASDGQDGLEKALKFVPDIVITDVMMPRKDGIELMQELRNNLQTSHIPVVLLTAKTDMDTRLKGIELGADSYITKPFSATYLEARVENLLQRRQRLQEFFRTHLMDERDTPVEEQQRKETEDSMSPQDRKFLERLTELMEKNMDNGDLLVDDLVRELAVSRSVFFKKLKSLTGLAPIEFIKEMRVQRAARLIEAGDYNMTQISYMVGINDPRYFSKCFKHRFGMTPTEYKEKHRG